MMKIFFKEWGGYWLFIAGLLMLPMLFFPFHGDHAIYLQAAETISNGGKIFVDFIDLKPAFLYYIYWAISEVFTSNAVFVRMFDLLFHIILFGLLFRLVNRYTQNELWAGLTILIYSLLYVAIGHVSTLQQAMFAGLANVGLMYLQLSELKNEKAEILNRIFAGLIIGIVTGIKYPFGIFLVAILVQDVFFSNYSLPRKLKRIFILGIGMFIGFILTLFPLLDSEVFGGFVQITELLSQYSTRPHWGTSLIKEFFIQVTLVFGDKLSAGVTLASLCGLFYFISKDNIPEKQKHLLTTAFIFTICLFCSAIVEKKFFVYHFVRMFPSWLIFSSLGVFLAIDFIKQNWKNFDKFKKSAVVGLLLMAFAFSPFVRYVFRLQAPIYYFTDKAKYNSVFKDREANAYNHTEALATSDFINSRYNDFGKEKPLLVAVQTASAIINYETPKFDHSVFGGSQFYFSIEAPAEWEEKALEEARGADMLVFYKADSSYLMFGHSDKYGREYSSYDYVFNLDTPYTLKYREMVKNNFTLVKESERYAVFEKNEYVK